MALSERRRSMAKEFTCELDGIFMRGETDDQPLAYAVGNDPRGLECPPGAHARRMIRAMPPSSAVSRFQRRFTVIAKTPSGEDGGCLQCVTALAMGPSSQD
jgi:hypothetical protein